MIRLKRLRANTYLLALGDRCRNRLNKAQAAHLLPHLKLVHVGTKVARKLSVERIEAVALLLLLGPLLLDCETRHLTGKAGARILLKVRELGEEVVAMLGRVDLGYGRRAAIAG